MNLEVQRRCESVQNRRGMDSEGFDVLALERCSELASELEA